jgi:hypothetical protein
MNNKYSNALKKMNETREFNAANKKKILALVLLASDTRVNDALKSNEVDAKYMNARALYVSEKVIKTVYSVTRDNLDISSIIENAFVAIKTALNARANDTTFTKIDIESAILSEVAIDEKRKHIVYARANKISAVAQVQQSIDMLKIMNVIKEQQRNVFSVTESDLTLLFAEKYKDVTL